MTQEYRARRTCLSVPASSPRFLVKARGLPADEIMLDLEDAVAPDAKQQARHEAVDALNAGGWEGRVMAVRVNGADSRWAYRDVIEVVTGAGSALDTIILPKVSAPAHVIWLDTMLGQLERDVAGPAGRIGIEAQIEDARGLAEVDAIASCSPRLRALVFGPADFMASMGMRSLRVGAAPEGYGADAYHYPLLRILVAARAHGLAAIDGPYAAIGDLDGLRRSATSSAALGYDGKWVVHPGQIGIVNEAFSPGQEEYEHAGRILDAYERATKDDRRGAVMLGEEMIDEASRKLALATLARARAAGLTRPAAGANRTAQEAPPAGRGSAQHPPGGEDLRESPGER